MERLGALPEAQREEQPGCKRHSDGELE